MLNKYSLDPMICRTCGAHGWISINDHYRNSAGNHCHNCNNFTMSTHIPYVFKNFKERSEAQPGAVM